MVYGIAKLTLLQQVSSFHDDREKHDREKRETAIFSRMLVLFEDARTIVQRQYKFPAGRFNCR